MTNGLTCKIEGCCGPQRARGWCSAHYQRWQKYGDPNTMLKPMSPKGDPLNWLREVALKHTDPGACLPWPYSKINNAYGQVKLDGRSQLVSRIICEHRHGPAPTPEHEAAHSCGKGHEACVNPWHIDWKTPSENQADKLDHGTHNRGERHPMAKITESDVHEIHRLVAGGMTQREIGEKFGVSQATISLIITGKNWAWLEVAT